jgi:Sigma-70 region 2
MSTSKHNPNGGATPHCDNGRIESLIAEYQATRNVETLAAIVALTRDRALTLIRFHRTTRYRSEDELLSDVNFRLIRAVDKFDPTRGHAFSFISQVVTNSLRTSVTTARKRPKQYVRLDKTVAGKLRTNGETESRYVVDDVVYRIKGAAKTTLTDETELSAQRWYIESFCADGFEHRRHECADAAMTVYGLSHDRSRELYDLTMLEG